MAMKKQKPPEEGSPAWMATFSDLMNLLLCFFVLLFASSNIDEEKVQRIIASFNDSSFSVLESGAVSLVDGQIVSGGVTQLPGIESVLEYIGVSSEVKGNNQDLSATGSDDGKEDSSDQPDSVEPNTEETLAEQISQSELKEQLEEEGEKQSARMYDEISELTESYKIEDNVTMDYNAQYVSLDLNGALLFEQGSADIREDAQKFMKKITSIIQKYQTSIIEIEGHTDNVPIRNSNFQSNRYLSTARATKVYEYIVDNTTFPDENLKVAGYGESRPVASNDSEEGRAKNRRVTIKIYNQLNSDLQESANP